MKRRGISTIIVSVILAIGLSGCGNTDPQTATLVLDSNPTTGFEWEAAQTSPIFEIQSEYVSDDTGGEILDGAGGTETFVLIPVKKGKATVTFTYARPWEGGEVGEVLTYQIKVDRSLHIDVISMSGEVPDVPEFTIE